MHVLVCACVFVCSCVFCVYVFVRLCACVCMFQLPIESCFVITHAAHISNTHVHHICAYTSLVFTVFHLFIIYYFLIFVCVQAAEMPTQASIDYMIAPARPAAVNADEAPLLIVSKHNEANTILKEYNSYISFVSLMKKILPTLTF